MISRGHVARTLWPLTSYDVQRAGKGLTESKKKKRLCFYFGDIKGDSQFIQNLISQILNEGITLVMCDPL